MNTYEITLQDENFNLHKLRKVKDSIYDPTQKIETFQWLWIYSDTSVFFHIELWDELERAYLNKQIVYKKLMFKVIEINNNNKILYS